MKATINLDQKVTALMTAQPTCVIADTSMVDVARHFEINTFHHIPVLDENHLAIGVISKSDLHQLQHHFTRLGDEHAQRSNQKVFKTLLASDVMTRNPISLNHEATLQDALNILMDNKFHSVIVTQDQQCIGIITAHDILKFINEATEVPQEV